MIDIIAHTNGAHQQLAAKALAAGLRRHGVESRIIPHTEHPTADVVACWGWRHGAKLRALGRNVLVMERAYVGDRFHWMSLGWNGLNGNAAFPEIDDGGARWRKHFDGMLRPWREPAAGAPIWLIGQVPTDAAVLGLDHDQWARIAARELAQHCRPIIFRPHPVATERGHRNLGVAADRDRGSESRSLTAAAWIVTQNSNFGVLAAVAGVPVVATDPGSMAWAVSGHRLAEVPPMPAREAWAHRLAWCQWLPEEIEDGTAWDAVGGVLAARSEAA